jgi:hypothetical protein
MFGSFLPEPWFGFGTTKSTQVRGADIVMKSPMCCLHILGMIVSPTAAHSFRIDMVGDDVIVIGEFFVADGANTGLLSDLAAQQFAHLAR